MSSLFNIILIVHHAQTSYIRMHPADQSIQISWRIFEECQTVSQVISTSGKEVSSLLGRRRDAVYQEAGR